MTPHRCADVVATHRVKTAYGPFLVCETCLAHFPHTHAERLPATFDAAPVCECEHANHAEPPAERPVSR